MNVYNCRTNYSLQNIFDIGYGLLMYIIKILNCCLKMGVFFD